MGRRLPADTRAGHPDGNLNTGTECHLDANMVHHALHHLPLDNIDILLVENVGNMACSSD
jgi:hydrogenase nickel incorporation protein HypB